MIYEKSRKIMNKCKSSTLQVLQVTLTNYGTRGRGHESPMDSLSISTQMVARGLELVSCRGAAFETEPFTGGVCAIPGSSRHN